MKQFRWGRGRWLVNGPLVAGLFVGFAYGQAGAGQAPAGPAPVPAPAAPVSTPNKVVLKVGDTSVTEGQIDRAIQSLSPQIQNSVARQGRKSIGDEYALMIVLSQEAVNHHLDSTPAYRDLLELSRLKLLASEEYQQILKQSAATPEEISKYYSEHQSEYEAIEVLQVVVRKKPADAKEGTPGLAPEEAKARLEEIRKAFLAGDDPKQIADKYQLQNVVRVDARPYPIHHGALRADMDKAAFALKPGEMTEDFDLGQALEFVKIVAHETDDLKSVSSRIETNLQNQKVKVALDALKKNAHVWLDDAYFAPPAGASQPSQPKPEPANTPATVK